MNASSKYLTIGKVVDKLKSDFPDLTISKIRFLEEEGLITLPRTKGGYRKFDKSDIDRLELILKMQKDLFLPLDVIKEKLEVSTEPILRAELKKGKKILPEPKIITSDSTRPLSVKELKSSAGISNEEIKKLENYGILKPSFQNKEKPYTNIDVEIVKIIMKLSDYGIEPRHLKMYANFAIREANLFKQIILPTLHSKSEDRKEKAEQTLTLLWKNSVQLKNLHLKKSLNEMVQNEFLSPSEK